MKKSREKFPVCIDFDGTLVSHRYPHIGIENKPCVEVLKKWTENGVGLILDTMRDGKELDEAVKWCKEHGIELYGIGKHPTQHTWTDSNKCYGQLSIDDRNLGVPLKKVDNERPMVDWVQIDEIFTSYVLRMANIYLNK